MSKYWSGGEYRQNAVLISTERSDLKTWNGIIGFIMDYCKSCHYPKEHGEISYLYDGCTSCKCAEKKVCLPLSPGCGNGCIQIVFPVSELISLANVLLESDSNYGGATWWKVKE